MKQQFRFAETDIGMTLDSLAYSQINVDGRYLFDRPIVITQSTLIELDYRHGTLCLISPNGRREMINGKWDR